MNHLPLKKHPRIYQFRRNFIVGSVLAIGTPEELRANPDPIVQQFLNREADEEKIDREKYLKSLVEG